MRDAIHKLKEEEYDFNYIAEMDIITLAQKHNMSVFEWKLNAMINKDKNLIINFPQDWRHGDILLIQDLTVIVFEYYSLSYVY